MQFKYLVLLLLILSFNLSVSAQQNSVETPICEQPFSSKFDEFEYTNLNAVREKLELFAMNIKESDKLQGFYIVYGGAKTKSGQARSIGWEVKDFLENNQKISYEKKFNYKIGGYRDNPYVELFIKPLGCSEQLRPTPTLSIEEVKFEEEDTVFPKDIIRKSEPELLDLLIKRVDPPYADVVRSTFASGKVLLLVLIDEKGNVVKTQFVEGHIMLEQSSKGAVEQWKFKPFKLKGKAVKITGKIYLDYKNLENREN